MPRTKKEKREPIINETISEEIQKMMQVEAELNEALAPFKNQIEQIELEMRKIKTQYREKTADSKKIIKMEILKYICDTWGDNPILYREDLEKLKLFMKDNNTVESMEGAISTLKRFNIIYRYGPKEDPNDWAPVRICTKELDEGAE